MTSNWTELIEDLRSESVDRFNNAWKTLPELADNSKIAELYVLLNDESIFVREISAYLLARLEGVRALPLIFESYNRGFEEEYEENEGMTHIIVDFLENNQGAVTPLLLDLLKSDDNKMLQTVAWALGFVSSQISSDPLIGLIKNSTDFKVRSAATGSLGSFKGHPEVYDQLVLLLKDPNFYVRDTAVIALGNLGDKRAIGILKEMEKNAPENERMSFYFALEKLSKEEQNGLT